MSETMSEEKLTETSSNLQSDERLSRRFNFLLWLRKTHSWLGLWGAVLGLLFGVTGFLLNHRTVMKIPAAKAEESSIQVALPSSQFKDIKAWEKWLQGELSIAQRPTRSRSEPAKPVAWGDQTVLQPEHWTANFASPSTNIQADYWLGNSFVTLKRQDNNIWATLNNLHKGSGASIAWVLLVDTLAGSILLLSITGVILWTKLNKRRTVGAGIVGVSLMLSLWFSWASF